METKITKTQTGKFKEFSESEQEQILNNYRDINVDYSDWNDYILINFIEDLKTQTGVEIEADQIFWAVGDRKAKFGVYSKDIINFLVDKFADNGVYDIDTPEKLGSFLNHRGGGICTQGSTETGLATAYFEDDSEAQEEQNKAVTEQINDIIDKIIVLSSEYHNKNEEAYNYSISDESVKEALEANEYDFDSETMRIF